MQQNPIEMRVSVNISQLANVISSLSESELELLEMQVTGEAQELFSRLEGLQSGKISLLSEKDVFDA